MKKFLTLIITISLIVPSLISQQTNAQQASLFSDVPIDHEYKEAINYLKQNNIVEGYEITGSDQKQFKPDYRLNRAEFTKILIESKFTQAEIDACIKNKQLKNWKTVHFPDVPIDAWFAKYICLAKEKNIVSGYPNGTFKPEQAINFAESAKVVTNTILNRREATNTPPVRGSGGSVPTEGSNTPWFEPFVESLAIRKAVPPSIRSFAKQVTRGEMANMVYASLEEPNLPSLNLETLKDTDSKDHELPQIDSCDSLAEHLKSEDIYSGIGLPRAMPFIMEDEATFNAIESAPAPKAEGLERSKSAEAVAPSDDYSGTNIQVEGVDEADIVKNDGKYIYTIKGKTVRIVEAYPASEMKEIAKIELDDNNFTPSEMYVDKDQMVIIGNVYRNRNFPEPLPLLPGIEPEFAPNMDIASFTNFGGNRIKLYTYDVTKRETPKKQRSVEIEGSLSSTRKIGKTVYLILNQWIPYYNHQKDDPVHIMLPRFLDSKNGEERPLTRCMNVQVFPKFTERNYLIAAALKIDDVNAELVRSVYLGNSSNIYSSTNNLYVATHHYAETEERTENDLRIRSESQTLTYRFSLSPTDIEYQNQGIVPGNILNQFSMDENATHFRIATTRDGILINNEYQSTNNLYILDKNDMSITGSVEDIAPGERIKSVRFLGNRAYMVTFRTTDPLFVIDIANATNPQILGKLKIPGWSDYLHPYDENHLLGFGREVDPTAEDANRITSDLLMGMKLSVFDVTDVANPKETFKEVIGASNTTSELLYNHKALLFDKEKNLLAFPITITENQSPNTERPWQTTKTVFAGGIVYKVDLTDGFTLKGKVTHYQDDSAYENDYGYFNPEHGRTIERMIYIGPSLYSISPDYIRAYDLNTIESQNLLKLEGDNQNDVSYLDNNDDDDDEDNLLVEDMPQVHISTNNPTVVLQTNLGNIEILLAQNTAPKSVENFLFHINEGNYNGSIFHRVIVNFIIQAGDFENNDGTGGYGLNGKGTTVDDEFHPDLRNFRGTVSMANAGPNTNGSQFFINLVNNHHLNNVNTVFGEVTKGIEIVDQISIMEVDETSKPLNEVRIESITLLQEPPTTTTAP
jgi:inhibitor of cysteine peptidase